MSQPTLRRLLITRFSSGAAVALVLMLIVALATADRLSSRAAAIGLLNGLKDGVAFAPGPGRGRGTGMGMRRGLGQGGTVEATADSMAGYAATWAPAHTVIERGEGFGYGQTPFSAVPAVWAALG